MEREPEQVVATGEQVSDEELVRRRHLLKIGKSVMVQVKGLDRLGVVRYVGETLFHPGVCWVGLELKLPVGKHDGAVQGFAYFNCKALHGIFVKPDAVIKEHSEKPPAHATQYVIDKLAALNDKLRANHENPQKHHNRRQSTGSVPVEQKVDDVPMDDDAAIDASSRGPSTDNLSKTMSTMTPNRRKAPTTRQTRTQSGQERSNIRSRSRDVLMGRKPPRIPSPVARRAKSPTVRSSNPRSMEDTKEVSVSLDQDFRKRPPSAASGASFGTTPQADLEAALSNSYFKMHVHANARGRQGSKD